MPLFFLFALIVEFRAFRHAEAEYAVRNIVIVNIALFLLAIAPPQAPDELFSNVELEIDIVPVL